MQLPSYYGPMVDRTEYLCLLNIALFHLTYIHSDVTDDAVSMCHIAFAYDSVMENNCALTQSMESLPRELDLDGYHLACSRYPRPCLSLLRHAERHHPHLALPHPLHTPPPAISQVFQA